MGIFFTADNHLGCCRLVEYSRKEFSSVEKHDTILLDNINRTVGRNDRLIIIGDFCKEKPGRYRPKIRCKNIMYVLGNHCRETKIRAVFGGNVRHQYMTKGTGENRFWCSHYPTCFWDRSHYGVYHCYGHLHDNTERESMMDLGMPGRRSMDVGVDHAARILGEYRPWSEKEVLAYLVGRLGHDIITKEERWNNESQN